MRELSRDVIVYKPNEIFFSSVRTVYGHNIEDRFTIIRIKNIFYISSQNCIQFIIFKLKYNLEELIFLIIYFFKQNLRHIMQVKLEPVIIL